MTFLRNSLLFCLLGLLLTTSITAQDSLAPDEITGSAVYVPFPIAIAVDGESEDWAGVPVTHVDRGSMLSPDAAENGSFDFSLAADNENLYILITMLDQNIVTGQHGADFWNEDSLEFYVNFTGDFLADSYTAGIAQININPGNIGLTDPTALALSGVNSSSLGVTGIVFKTDAGWGFEGAIPLAEAPAHGHEIGFQVQANGATELDRNVKLIWSLADTADTSWNNPAVFGRALFFEVGSADVPQPSVVVEEPEPVREFIAVNQTGYFTNSIKKAVYAREAKTTGSPPFQLIDNANDEAVYAGIMAAALDDSASGDIVYAIDFSQFTTPGTYRLRVNSIESAPFTIGTTIYDRLKVDALRYFYLNRSGIELTAEFAGDAYARPAGHLTDGDVTCFKGDAAGQTFDGCDYRLNAAGGWYDAGDFGKYVVNGGIATWTLLNWYERSPESFPDGSLNIPESSNGVADILDEARWEMEWLLSMQVPEGQALAGMAHHKLHALQWDGLPVMPPTNVENSDPQKERLLMPPSTAATLNLSATAAQCARIWRDIDAAFADRCLQAAKTAFDAAQAHPDIFYGSIPGNGGGDYGDGDVSDEFYWAATELFITTGEDVYRDALMDSRHFKAFPGGMWWGGTGTLGTISLLTAANELPEDEVARLREQIINAADNYRTVVETEGYGVSMRASEYVWGSSSTVLNNAIIMALAYDFTEDEGYLNAVIRSMDYLLGNNANDMSFVSGYGTNAMSHPHHRVWANLPPQFPPPPPGAIAGGANGSPADQKAITEIGELPTARRYIDHVDSYSTNEVAVNWNSPLVWVATYLNEQFKS
jgi:endoglucanase